MIAPPQNRGLLEARLAHLLAMGTWLGSALIALGIAQAYGWVPNITRPVSLQVLGILVFILLPVARVLFMLWAFLRSHERDFAWLAALVLAIIATGLLLGAGAG